MFANPIDDLRHTNPNATVTLTATDLITTENIDSTDKYFNSEDSPLVDYYRKSGDLTVYKYVHNAGSSKAQTSYGYCWKE